MSQNIKYHDIQSDKKRRQECQERHLLSAAKRPCPHTLECPCQSSAGDHLHTYLGTPEHCRAFSSKRWSALVTRSTHGRDVANTLWLKFWDGQKTNRSPNLPILQSLHPTCFETAKSKMVDECFMQKLEASPNSSALLHKTLPTAFYFLWSEDRTTFLQATLVFLIIFMRFEFFSDSNWMELVASANHIQRGFSLSACSEPHLNQICFPLAFHSSEFATWSNHALWVEFSPHLSGANESPRKNTTHTHTHKELAEF